MKTSLVNSDNTKNIFIFIALLVFALFIAQAIINPQPKTVKAALLCILLAFCLVAKQDYLVYLVILLLFFTASLNPIYNTSNGVIIAAVIILFVRSQIQKYSVISLKKIVNNSFFKPSCFIFFAYFISWLRAYFNKSPGMDSHTGLFFGTGCALLMGNMLTGFIQDKKRFFNVHNIFLIALLLNLTFGILTLFNKEITLIPQVVKSGSVFVGSGTDFAFRLGGFSFYWEAYAEYLMMMFVIISGMIMVLAPTIKSRLLKISLYLLLLIILFELFLTNTRVAVLVAGLGFLIINFIYLPFRLGKRIFIGVVLILAVAVILFIAQQTGYFSLFKRFTTFSNISRTEYGYLPQGRAGVWSAVLRHISKEGLMGSGPSFMPLTRYEKGHGTLVWPHNIILIILSTVGIIGFCAFAFLFLKFTQLYKKIPSIKDFYIKNLYAFLWLALLLFLIDEMKFDGFLRHPDSYSYFIWSITAFMFSGENFIKQDE